jgi:Caspase domain
MTNLIVDKIDLNRPQTHVLVVGVNDYPYLKNGALSGQGIESHLGLDQLRAPVNSACAVAELFRTVYNNPDAQLGSIAALLSGGLYSTPGLSTGVPVAEPTFDDIKDATSAWISRLDAQRDSVGVFYFCGHGVEPSALLLLAQDFGRDRFNPWDNAVNLTATHANMAQINAKTQLFLIDACRNSPLDASDAAVKSAKNSGSLGRALVGVLPGRVYQQRAAPLIISAPLGQKTYAPSGPQAVSYFANAIVECVSQGGADRFDGQEWIVTADSIARNLKDRLQRVRLPNGGNAACDCTGTSNFSVDIHRFGGRAKVLARIVTTPETAMHQAKLKLSEPNGQPLTYGPNGQPWEDELLSGTDWTLEVILPPNSQWSSKTFNGQVVYPPMYTPRVGWP